MKNIHDEMNYLDAPIGEIEIDRAHRTGKKYKDENGKWQQPVLLKLNSWSARNQMYKLCRHSHFHMKADLTTRKENVLNYAKEQISKENSLAKKYINYVYADANCTLSAFTTTGRFLRFNTEFEFDMHVLYTDNTTRESEKVYDVLGKDWESDWE